jgi:hypothetical protein
MPGERKIGIASSIFLPELDGRQLAKAGVGYFAAALRQPKLCLLAVSVRFRKTRMSRIPRRKLPLKSSMTPFCAGLPGLMQSGLLPLRYAHSARARATNLRALST